jgi:hypothetical protein
MLYHNSKETTTLLDWTKLVHLSCLIFSFFNDKRLLAPKYSETLHLKCSAPFIFLIDSPIGCSAPLYSRSGSLIRSTYYFLYISFCFRFNKSLTNLTSLRQHHLQYTFTNKNFSKCYFVFCVTHLIVIMSYVSAPN